MDGSLCPLLSTVPISPFSFIPAWLANRTTILPSFGQWLEKAFQPVMPVIGNPARPPSEKTLPKRLAKRFVISTSES